MASGLLIERLQLSLCEGGQSLSFFDLQALEFQAGISILWGISGSGKTTFLEALCGMRTADAFQLRLDGYSYDLCKTSQRERFFSNHISVQYQDPEIFKDLSCVENLRLMERFASKPAPPYGFFLDVVMALGLESVLDKPAKQVSRGEAQRLSIARALLYSQRILVLDEPLVFFQKDLQLRIWELIQTLVQRRDLICIMATHDPNFSHPQGKGGLYQCVRTEDGLSRIEKA